jgi:hypothetical protein
MAKITVTWTNEELSPEGLPLALQNPDSKDVLRVIEAQILRGKTGGEVKGWDGATVCVWELSHLNLELALLREALKCLEEWNDGRDEWNRAEDERPLIPRIKAALAAAKSSPPPPSRPPP